MCVRESGRVGGRAGADRGVLADCIIKLLRRLPLSTPLLSSLAVCVRVLVNCCCKQSLAEARKRSSSVNIDDTLSTTYNPHQFPITHKYTHAAQFYCPKFRTQEVWVLNNSTIDAKDGPPAARGRCLFICLIRKMVDAVTV